METDLRALRTMVSAYGSQFNNPVRRDGNPTSSTGANDKEKPLGHNSIIPFAGMETSPAALTAAAI